MLPKPSNFYARVKSSTDILCAHFLQSFKPRYTSRSLYGSAYTVKKTTLKIIREKYEQGAALTAVTAYDYSSATHVDLADIDILLVGDSASMVIHGHDTTLPITIEEMLVHCRSVSRGAKKAFLVGDIPFGSYENGDEHLLKVGIRILKEGGMHAVKLEGAGNLQVSAVRKLNQAGVAVMGHIGLTPQSVSLFGGFRPQGNSARAAVKLVEQAIELQDAGCFSIVLECLPDCVSAAITASVNIPTIGIGAGSSTNGQILVYHDLLGFLQHPHHAKVTPKFCKQYAQVGRVINDAMLHFKQDVATGKFPGVVFSPYILKHRERKIFVELLKKSGYYEAASSVEASQN